MNDKELVHIIHSVFTEIVKKIEKDVLYHINLVNYSDYIYNNLWITVDIKEMLKYSLIGLKESIKNIYIKSEYVVNFIHIIEQYYIVFYKYNLHKDKKMFFPESIKQYKEYSDIIENKLNLLKNF